MKTSTTIVNKIFTLEALVLLYFFLLLVFGTYFSKFKIAGPIYMHDLFLGIVTILAINYRRKISLRFTPILLIVALAFIYFFYSLIFLHPRGILLLMTFRQFNLFLYLFCAYIIFNMLIRNKEDYYKPIKLLKWIAQASMVLQIAYLLYGFIFIPNFSLFEEGAYNYFSPLAIFGIISYGALVLAFEKNTTIRFAKFFFCILLSTTLGHASAFFALFLMFLIYFFVRITPQQRLIAVGIIVLALISLLFLPQFTDVNAGWRLLYWKHVLQQLIYNKLMVFGHGFGQPYMTSDYANYLNEKLHSPIMMASYDPLARYQSPPHNSFLTIAFHIGLLPALFLLVPIKGYFSQLFFKSVAQDTNRNFLIYLLTGCFTWVSFNVILELPHSATYFWFVYFATTLYLNEANTSFSSLKKVKTINSDAAT